MYTRIWTSTGDGGHPRVSRRLVLGGMGVIGVASLVGGCASTQPRQAYVYHPDDAAFFEAQGGTSAAMENEYSSIKEMASASAAVVTATITDVAILHELKAADDHFFTYGWVLAVSETVRSSAGPLGEVATVELFGGSPDPEVVPELKSHLPKSELILFLRSNVESWETEEKRLAGQGKTMSPEHAAWRAATGDMYTLVNSQGVCAQGEDGVAKSFVHEGDAQDAIDKELKSYESLSDLVDYISEL